MEMNKSFTCIGRGHGAPCLPSGREEWEEMRRQPWLQEMCRRIEQGEEQLKHRLPVWTPHCAEFRGNHRAISDALRPLSRLMMDFDEKGHTGDILSQLKVKSKKLKVAGLEVLLVEESVRRGTHVLVALPEGMTADEAQRLMAEATGFVPDKAVKDVARCIYMVPEDHTRYVSERLFDASEHTGKTEEQNMNREEKENAQFSIFNSQLSYRGIPYSTIVAEFWARTGGEPVEGERNVRLHQLAVCLRSICDNRRDVLMQVMPRLGLDEQEVRSIVDSATKEAPKGISKLMQGIVSSEERRVKSEESELLNRSDTNSNPSPLTLHPLPKKNTLPIGLRESLVGVPVEMQMPVLCGVLPLAAAYADGVEVEYCDGQRHRLGLMSIIRGEQASGKSVVKGAIDVWKRQLDEEDRLARRREEQWRERKKGRKANEKAPEDPRVLVRMMPVTVSCSTLLRRLKNAQGHTLYSFGEELDTLRKTNGAGSWSSKYDIYRLSFDQGEWGQDYNSDAAESGVVRVAYNWTMLGTNGAMRKCFRQDNIENGLSSRILVAEMPDASFQRMPRFGRRSAEDEARIQEAVGRLRSCSGFVDTPRLRKAIGRWVEEKRVEAAKDIDYVKDTYRKRAAVIGFRCGVIHHLLQTLPQPLPFREGSSNNSEQEGLQKKNVPTPLPTREGQGGGSEGVATIRFALMMAEYCLAQQIAAFGETLQGEYASSESEQRRQGTNHSVYDQLPKTFTLGDLRVLKQGFCGESALRKIISRWCLDRWAEKIDKSHWRKTESVTV